MAVKPLLGLFHTNWDIIMEELIVLRIVYPFNLLGYIGFFKFPYGYFHFLPRPIYQPLFHCRLLYLNV